MVAPRRSTVSARPRTSRAGCTRAQCGVKLAPSARRCAARSRSSSGSSSRMSSSPKPPLALGFDLRPQAAELGRVLGDVERCRRARDRRRCPPPRTPARPRPGCRSPHVRVAPRHRVREGAHSARGCRWPCRQPAAVAARCSEARVLGLEHGDAQCRVGEPQVVGGPEPGVAAADDRDVDVEIAREPRTPRRRAELGLPEPAVPGPHSTKKRPVSPPPYQRLVTVVLRV